MMVTEPAQAAIWNCLNHYDHLDAIFLSERLYAEVKTTESLLLLATANYQSGRHINAYHLLKNNCYNSSQCQFLFGKCAYELGKYAEAEAALLGNDDCTVRSLDDVIKIFKEQAAFVLLLLGEIAAKTERKSRAIDAWRKALKLNPFLFSAFQSLCKIGDSPNPSNFFQINGNLDFTSLCCTEQSINNEEYPNNNGNENIGNFTESTPKQRLTTTGFVANQKDFVTPDISPLANPLCISGIGPLLSSHHKNSHLKNEAIYSENSAFGQYYHPTTSENKRPSSLADGKHHKSRTKKICTFKQMEAQITKTSNSNREVTQSSNPVFTESSNVPVHTKTPTSTLNVQPSQNIKRSYRLYSSYSVKENTKSPHKNKFVTPKSPSRKTRQRMTTRSTNSSTTVKSNKQLQQLRTETITSDSEKINSGENANVQCVPTTVELQKHSIEGLLNLLRDLGDAYLDLSKYNCKSALQKLHKLPTHQLNTSWIYSLIGIAYFELADYEPSIKYFKKVHEQEPYRMEFMDIYSSILWHTQKEVALSALAQDLVDIDKNNPVTWLVLGNCFSLHKEHDTAIKFFQRAVQVDPNFTYAYSLLGLEYITTEELDKAMSCFRNAVRLNSEHYNAWFGIGTIYAKQEKYHLAEFNYNKALAINPHSCVILCHIGIVQHSLKQTTKALATFNKAIQNNPDSPLCKFHRATVHFALGKYDEALEELEELKALVPKESSVYYLIGNIHKKMGRNDLALQHFSWATDLDPKGASSQIKEAFDPEHLTTTRTLGTPESPSQQGDASNYEGLPYDSEDSTF